VSASSELADETEHEQADQDGDEVPVVKEIDNLLHDFPLRSDVVCADGEVDEE
jgi:hypothetical protein